VEGVYLNKKNKEKDVKRKERQWLFPRSGPATTADWYSPYFPSKLKSRSLREKVNSNRERERFQLEDNYPPLLFLVIWPLS
jgi:hypothetical protein